MAATRKLDVLFVGDKWNENDPSCGLSMHHNIILGSLESTGFAEIRTLFYDEETVQGRDVDTRILESCRTKPDLLLCHYSIGFYRLPSPQTFAILRDAGIPIVFLWYDLVYWPNPRIIDELLVPVSSVNVVFDVDAYKTTSPGSYLNLWAPYDARYYKDPGFDRSIELSYLGSVGQHPRRSEVLETLKASGIPIQVGGGMIGSRSNVLTREDYCGILQRSKMSINFSWASPGAPPAWYPVVPDQVKGRVFEVMLCGALLLESQNDQIQRYFTPFEHYVPWSSPADLLDKIQYYKVHEEERIRIAKKGHERASEHFSAAQFWKRVLERVGLSAAAPAAGEGLDIAG